MKDYFSNIKHINDFLKEELKNTIIIPVLTNDIALKETNDYSNFAYMSGKDYYNNAITLKQATDKKNKEFAKSKLKHSIIKNMSYNNDIKTRQYAEYYYNKINDSTYKENDKIAYYLDFVNEYNLLTNVIDFVVNEKLSEVEQETLEETKKAKQSEVEQAKLAQNAAYKFKEEISKHNNDKNLLKQATVIYLGPFIFQKYNLIDILILCGIILLIILLYSIKHIINIYIIGIILLMIMICIVFLTVIFI
jgi:hypothetical protein